MKPSAHDYNPGYPSDEQSTPVIKRCRPLLGTFVEISLVDPQSCFSEAEIQNAFREAFAAIDKTGALMSFHDPDSQLTRLNRHPVGDWLEVDPQLIEVLTLARELQLRTEHRFNVSIARPLMQWGILPSTQSDPCADEARSSDITGDQLRTLGFELDHRVRRTHRQQIDLGGIAKGYAVDRAVEALHHILYGISGCVNAGGDLRVFGETAFPILIRDGRQEDSHTEWQLIQNEALATTTVVVQSKDDTPSPSSPRMSAASPARSAYVDTYTGQPLLQAQTIVARAKKCMLADAFTKVGLLFSGNVTKLAQLAAEYEVTLNVVDRDVWNPNSQ
jgi:thiamine biosynthesis lipoprotein